MEHYKYDTANNIIALARSRAKDDPQQIDVLLFRNHFIKQMAPEYKRNYGKPLKWGPYEEIIAQVEKDFPKIVVDYQQLMKKE